MPNEIKRLCPICRDAEIELTPYRTGYLAFRASPLMTADLPLETETYVCPRCRYAAFFVLPSPMEEYEKQQVLQEALSPVEKFEHTFQNYSDKQLQKVIDGKTTSPMPKRLPETCCTAGNTANDKGGRPMTKACPAGADRYKPNQKRKRRPVSSSFMHLHFGRCAAIPPATRRTASPVPAGWRYWGRRRRYHIVKDIGVI